MAYFRSTAAGAAEADQPPTSATTASAAAPALPLTVTVPCRRQAMVALLSITATGDLPPFVPPTAALLAEVDAAAASLGASAGLARAARVPSLSRLTFSTDLYALCPDWWRVNAEEEARACPGHASAAGAAAGPVLVNVDAALAATLTLCPLPKDDRWLFPPLRPREAPAPGERVLAADPAASLSAAVPREVRDLLRRFPDRLVLAGGSVTGAVSLPPCKVHDWDLFVHSTDAAGANDVLAAASAALRGLYTESYSRGAVTFFPSNIVAAPVQLVRCLYRDRAQARPPACASSWCCAKRAHCAFSTRPQVLESFDLAPTKALCRAPADGGDGGGLLVVEALPAWVEAQRRKAFWLNPAVWGESSPARAIKYVAKGFECALPGVRRSLLDCDRILGAAEHGSTATYAALFCAEARLLVNEAVKAEAGDGDDEELEADDDEAYGDGARRETQYKRFGIAGGANGYRICCGDAELAAATAPLTESQAAAVSRVVLAAEEPREYVSTYYGGRWSGFHRSYGFAMAPAPGTETGPNEPGVLVDEGCAELPGPRFQQADPALAELHSAELLFLLGAAGPSSAPLPGP